MLIWRLRCEKKLDISQSMEAPSWRKNVPQPTISYFPDSRTPKISVLIKYRPRRKIILNKKQNVVLGIRILVRLKFGNQQLCSEICQKQLFFPPSRDMPWIQKPSNPMYCGNQCIVIIYWRLFFVAGSRRVEKNCLFPSFKMLLYYCWISLTSRLKIRAYVFY